MKKQISKIEMVTRQLALIDETNEIIELFKKKKKDLMIRQYEHLKKKYIKNLYEMLAESYQIPIPKMEKEAA